MDVLLLDGRVSDRANLGCQISTHFVCGLPGLFADAVANTPQLPADGQDRKQLYYRHQTA